jgi:predicted nucleic-acid-binding Zn-ribbon protein
MSFSAWDVHRGPNRRRRRRLGRLDDPDEPVTEGLSMSGGYQCPKCGHGVYESSEFRATGGFLTKIFDIQSKRFTTVTCGRCRYTELYQTDQSTLGNVFDFFTRG